MNRRRVAITGLGLLVPHGDQPAEVFDLLLKGQSAVEALTLTSGGNSIAVAAALVKGAAVAALPRAQRALTDRVTQLALVAAGLGIADAGLNLSEMDRSRVGVSVGTCMGGIISTESAYESLFRRNSNRVAPFTLVKTMYNAPAAHLAIQYGITGPALTYTNTCSSSTVAIGEAMRQIRHGYVDVMIAGGSEALLAWGSIKAWLALQIIAPLRDDDPSSTCRPFSRDRAGTVIGEGAAFLILEELERAKARGARIYAELVGYGVVNDSSHLTQPTVPGQARAIGSALADANIPADAIDYVNAHGTATARNDIVETHAIREVFGSHANKLAVSSTKAIHGHLVGAAGALEMAICTMAIHQQAVPPTAHLHFADTECDLDYVPHVGRSQTVNAALSNSFAFGGVASSLVAIKMP
jgi:3-oxoacyl-[acyl-carrier-protein] synthase II